MTVDSDDGALAIGGSVQRSVLALLALQRGRPMVDALLEGAWAEEPVSGTRAVRVAVSRLRPAIEAIEAIGGQLLRSLAPFRQSGTDDAARRAPSGHRTLLAWTPTSEGAGRVPITVDG